MKWNTRLFGLVLILSTSVAYGQQMSNVSGPVAAEIERSNKFTAACAHRDLQLTTLIDQHGEDRDIVGEKLLEAYFIIMDARATCARGQESEALTLYDSVIRISVPARPTR
jgi:hypothetical protein